MSAAAPSDLALALVDDPGAVARVLEALVVRGDVSGLSPADRKRHYLRVCADLGLNPATAPFQILKVQGREIFYPTRVATDQLAAIHRLNREIVGAPVVEDLCGVKIIRAVCRARHPNGRVETATATCAFAADPVNAPMKVETKSKRRVTLSILGLGALDEDARDDLARMIRGAPGSSPAEIELDPPPPPPAAGAAALTAARAQLDAAIARIQKADDAVPVWIAYRAAVTAAMPGDDAPRAAARQAAMAPAWGALVAAVESRCKMTGVSKWLGATVKKRLEAPGDDAPEVLEKRAPRDGGESAGYDATEPPVDLTWREARGEALRTAVFVRDGREWFDYLAQDDDEGHVAGAFVKRQRAFAEGGVYDARLETVRGVLCARFGYSRDDADELLHKVAIHNTGEALKAPLRT